MDQGTIVLLSVAGSLVIAAATLAAYRIGRGHAERDTYAAQELAFAIDFFFQLAGDDDGFAFLDLVRHGHVEPLRRDWPEWFTYRDHRFLRLEDE